MSAISESGSSELIRWKRLPPAPGNYPIIWSVTKSEAWLTRVWSHENPFSLICVMCCRRLATLSFWYSVQCVDPCVLFFLTSFLYINDISLNRPCIIYIHNNRKKLFFSLIEPPRLSLIFTFFMFFWSNYRVMMTEIWSIMQMRSHQRWTSTVCSSPSTDLTPPALVWIRLSPLSSNRPVTILQATI